MATARRTRTPAAPVEEPTEPATPLMKQRVQIEYIDLNDITPYPYNPRDNEKAIPAVAASIRTFGFLVPCVVDENNILVAGHTRTEAAKLLGLTEVPCVRATGLSPEEINAFRLIDNKVAEQAQWDFDLLAGEIAKLEGLNLDYTEFGWSQQEVDCLTSLVAADCLSPEGVIEVAAETGGNDTTRRAPATARVVIGEFVFFIPATTYRNWADGIRQLANFNEDDIITELKRRLAILE